MVDFEFRIGKEKLLEGLKSANEYAKNQHGTDKFMFTWNGENLALKIQDDYLWVESGDTAWVSLDAKEFTSEMLILIFEKNPALATEEVLKSFLKAAGLMGIE